MDERRITRRDFLKIAGLSLGAVGLAVRGGVESAGGSAGSVIDSSGSQQGKQGIAPMERDELSKNEIELFEESFRNGSSVAFRSFDGGFSPDALNSVNVNIFVSDSDPDREMWRVKNAKVSIVRPDDEGEYVKNTVDLKNNPSLAVIGLNLNDRGQRITVTAPPFWTTDGMEFEKLSLKKPSEGPSEVHIKVYVSKPGGKPRRVPDPDQNA